MRHLGIKQQPLVRVDAPVVFTIDSGLPLKHQFVPRLEQHLRLSEEAQQEYPWKKLAVQHFILRPTSTSLDSFADRAWSSSEWGPGVSW